MNTLQYVLLFLFLVAIFCLYKLMQAIRKSKSDYKKKEQIVLLTKLKKNPDDPIFVIEEFEKEVQKPCTKVLFILPLRDWSRHFIVSIGENSYHYGYNQKNGWYWIPDHKMKSSG